ncbi:hypothetical protein CLU79DRAFT_725785 [Phycomyces nitens]|nr:hypothetical protein CLU79DRAFT_725785 [Phycomyces nitens]
MQQSVTFFFASQNKIKKSNVNDQLSFIMEHSNPEHLFVGCLHFGSGHELALGEPLPGLCVLKNGSPGQTVQSSLFNVSYHLIAVVPCASVQAQMFAGQQLDVSTIPEESERLRQFLCNVFGKKLADSGKCKNALLLEMRKDDLPNPFLLDEVYPFSRKTYIAIFGEAPHPKEDPRIYAYELYSIDELSSTIDFSYDIFSRQTKADLRDAATYAIRRLDAIAKLTESEKSERAKDSLMADKQKASSQVSSQVSSLVSSPAEIEQDPYKFVEEREDDRKRPIITKVPHERKALEKSVATKMSFYETGNKNFLKTMIWERVMKQYNNKRSDEAKELYQQVYSSVQYVFRNQITVCELGGITTINVIDNHITFYNDMEKFVTKYTPRG